MPSRACGMLFFVGAFEKQEGIINVACFWAALYGNIFSMAFLVILDASIPFHHVRHLLGWKRCWARERTVIDLCMNSRRRMVALFKVPQHQRKQRSVRRDTRDKLWTYGNVSMSPLFIFEWASGAGLLMLIDCWYEALNGGPGSNEAF